MKISRLFCGLSALFFLLCFFAVTARAERASLKISGWTRPFNVPVMLELAWDSYNDAFSDFAVSMVDMQSGPNLMAALEAGEVDIVQGIGDAAFLVSASEGIDAKIFAVNSRSPKAFAVVSNTPEVKSIEDLKGKRVVGLRGSVVHQVFVEALKEKGMTEADVEFFPMPVANAAATLLAGKADAALLVGGDILRAQKSGAVVLADGEGRVRGLSYAVIRTPFLREHPDAADRFLAMRRATLTAIKENPAEALKAAAKDIGQDISYVESTMSWYDFDCDVTGDDIESMNSTKKYLLENGIIRKDIDISSFFLSSAH
jgi:sulfonate transport system substrate-binding protein